jgi:biofilm PGA synthesis protein PgaD
MKWKKGLPLIIERPSLMPWPKRASWGMITVVFWMTWAYLWLPILTSLAWAMGYEQASHYFAWSSKDADMGRVFGLYAVVIAALGSSLLLWAQVEYLRFRNVHRRTEPHAVKVEELAAYAGLRAEDMRAWQNSRCLVVAHDNHGNVLDAEIKG